MRPLKATLILWLKSEGDSEGERMISWAKEANILDHVEKASQIDDIGRTIVVSDSLHLRQTLKDCPVVLEIDPGLGASPFGEKLGSVIRKHGGHTVLYMGGGSGVFTEIEDMARMTQAVLAQPEMLLVNNFHSTDFAAFGRAVEISGLQRCRLDNQLGWVMGREAGVRTQVLPSSLATRFDIDTPTDLMVLKVHSVGGRHLSAVLSRLPLDLSPLCRLMEVLVHRDREAAIMGRIPPEIACFFDRETACHIRFHIEERGMDSREKGDRVWSLVGLCLERPGIPGFFQLLSTHSLAAIIDTRVLFRHLGLSPSRRDRFFSDLLKPEAVTDPSVRLFTEQAAHSSTPILLGGQSLVSGGLYALVETAWKHVRVPPDRGIEEFEPWESGSQAQRSDGTPFQPEKELDHGVFGLR